MFLFKSFHHLKLLNTWWSKRFPFVSIHLDLISFLWPFNLGSRVTSMFVGVSIIRNYQQKDEFVIFFILLT